MQIVALTYISMSELVKVKPDITSAWVNENYEEFLTMLYSLGLDTNIPFEIQGNIRHRNRFGEVVTCDRYVGNERLDRQWLCSGYASVEAADKSKNNHLLTDLYRMRGMTE